MSKSNGKNPQKPTNQRIRVWENGFFEALSLTGNVTWSAEQVGKCRSYMHELKQKDALFAKRWDDALDEAADRLEKEAHRRAVEGTLRPVFQKGEEVGAIREFSDTLMCLLLKAHKPEKYRERTENINRNVNEDRVAGGKPEEQNKEVFERINRLAGIEN